MSHKNEGKNAALVLVEQAVLCILHMENCIGEKLITMLLLLGAKMCQSQWRATTLDGYVE
jgi:hypothetical protein